MHATNLAMHSFLTISCSCSSFGDDENRALPDKDRALADAHSSLASKKGHLLSLKENLRSEKKLKFEAQLKNLLLQVEKLKENNDLVKATQCENATLKQRYVGHSPNPET